jgi:hypothetical protein
MEEMSDLTVDPMQEAYLRLAKRPVPGDTPEERLENFMADLDYLPPDLYQMIREDAAREFGVEIPATADSEPDQP